MQEGVIQHHNQHVGNFRFSGFVTLHGKERTSHEHFKSKGFKMWQFRRNVPCERPWCRCSRPWNLWQSTQRRSFGNKIWGTVVVRCGAMVWLVGLLLERTVFKVTCILFLDVKSQGQHAKLTAGAWIFETSFVQDYPHRTVPGQRDRLAITHLIIQCKPLLNPRNPCIHGIQAGPNAGNMFPVYVLDLDVEKHWPKEYPDLGHDVGEGGALI